MGSRFLGHSGGSWVFILLHEACSIKSLHTPGACSIKSLHTPAWGMQYRVFVHSWGMQYRVFVHSWGMQYIESLYTLLGHAVWSLCTLLGHVQTPEAHSSYEQQSLIWELCGHQKWSIRCYWEIKGEWENNVFWTKVCVWYKQLTYTWDTNWVLLIKIIISCRTIPVYPWFVIITCLWGDK